MELSATKSEEITPHTVPTMEKCTCQQARRHTESESSGDHGGLGQDAL